MIRIRLWALVLVGACAEGNCDAGTTFNNKVGGVGSLTAAPSLLTMCWLPEGEGGPAREVGVVTLMNESDLGSGATVRVEVGASEFLDGEWVEGSSGSILPQDSKELRVIAKRFFVGTQRLPLELESGETGGKFGTPEVGEDFVLVRNTCGEPDDGGGAEPATCEDLPGVDQIDVSVDYPDGSPLPVVTVTTAFDGLRFFSVKDLDCLNVTGAAGWGTVGAVPLVLEQTGGDPRVAMLTYGNEGRGVTHLDPDTQRWGLVLTQTGSVSDVSRYPEDPSGAVVVVSGRDEVRFTDWFHDDAQDLDFLFVDSGFASAAFPNASGFVVSAFAFAPGGPVYFVTEGEPGQLWCKTDPRGPDPAERIGEVGDLPRRIRFCDGVGVVTNSGSNTITIVVLDDDGDPAIVGTVPVGEQPIGIGIGKRADGRIAVLTTGFLDDTYTITVLNGDGTVHAAETAPVPEGGQGPGHAVWVDEALARAAVACNVSEQLIVFPVTQPE